MADGAAYWLLIAVLSSTLPLEPALAMRLYHAAVDLHLRQAGRSLLQGDLATGEVRRLGRDLLLGSVGGPGFEAELDTPRGHGSVRFILTRQGLDEATERRSGPPGQSGPSGQPQGSTLN